MTSFLLYALPPVLTFLAGLWSATYLQDRADRRRHLGIVRALQAEVKRLRREAMLDRQERIPIAIFGSKPLLPKPGSWVEALLADIASTSPAVVTCYLELDRCFDNMSATEKIADATTEHVDSVRDKLQGAERTYEAEPVERIGETLTAVMMAKRDLERAEGNQEFGQFVADTAVKQARAALDAMDSTLDSLERDLANSLRTHTPWRRR